MMQPTREDQDYTYYRIFGCHELKVGKLTPVLTGVPFAEIQTLKKNKLAGFMHL